MIPTYTAGAKGAIVVGAKILAISVPYIMLADGKIDEQTYVPLLWFVVSVTTALSVGMFVKGIMDSRKMGELNIKHDKEMSDRRMAELETSLAKHELLLTAIKTATDEAKLHHQFICPMVQASSLAQPQPTKIKPIKSEYE